MALEKQIVVDQIEIVENGCVQVRTATRIVEDGQIISTTLHRHVIAPGDDYSNEVKKVKDVCALVHTPQVVKTYQDFLAQLSESAA